MKRLLSLLIFSCVCTHAVLALQDSVKKETHISQDTTGRGNNSLKNNAIIRGAKTEFSDVTGAVSQTREVGEKGTAQLKKLRDVASKDTVGIDSARKGNLVVNAVRDDVKDVRDKAVQAGKDAKSSTTGQVNKITSVVRPGDRDPKAEGRRILEQSVDGGAIDDADRIESDLKRDADRLDKRAELKSQIPDSSSVKEIYGDHNRQVLEDKALKLQYSSDDPDKAPWKSSPYGQDDLKDFKLPVNGPAIPGGDDKSAVYGEKIKSMEAPSASENVVREKLKQNAVSNLIDSLSLATDKLSAESVLQQLNGAKKVYSDKYIQRLSDSLGIAGAEELLNISSALLKTEAGNHDLLDRINSEMTGKEMNGVGYDAENQALKVKDLDRMNSLQNGSITDLKLPDSVLSKLPPLAGKQMDSKYMGMIDSMREVIMRKKDYLLDEKQMTEDLKRATLKEKPKFLDHVYFEGIIGFFMDSTMNVFQFSPALAYRFGNFLSMGLGPNLLVQVKDKKLNLQGGFRTFVKAEVWKQRAYLQVEDNVAPSVVNREMLNKKLGHELLGGGGVLLPVSKSLAINFAAFYRLNKDADNPHRSPWVIRVGLSSIKKK